MRAAVRAAGYQAATTVEPGIAAPGDDPFALPRIRVNGTDSAATVLGEPARRHGVGRARSAAELRAQACASASTACAALRPLSAITLPAGCVAAPQK